MLFPRRYTAAGLGLLCVACLLYASCTQRGGRISETARTGPDPPTAALKLARLEATPPPAPAAPETQPTAARRPIRAIWVARSHYRTPEDIRAIMANCAAHGFNTVYWQVRGEATVSYPSQIEPWGKEWGFRDPGFDPLRLALDEARRHGLRLEAWVNVLPGWRGASPPSVAEQLYLAQPDWFLWDAQGRRQPLSDFYVLLNPCLPEVRAHIIRVIAEIAENYEIDGIHLDYVRYAWETTRNAMRLYPRDPRTLALYREQTGRQPDDDIAAWNRWRADQLTLLVEGIRAALKERRPNATLTAAVKGDPADGYRGYLQSGAEWLKRGLLDAAMPMAYTPKQSLFERQIGAYYQQAPGRPVVPGIGVYQMTTPEQFRAQLECCQRWAADLAVFSYDSLFDNAEDRTQRSDTRANPALRSMRRQVWGEFIAGLPE